MFKINVGQTVQLAGYSDDWQVVDTAVYYGKRYYLLDNGDDVEDGVQFIVDWSGTVQLWHVENGWADLEEKIGFNL